ETDSVEDVVQEHVTTALQQVVGVLLLATQEDEVPLGAGVVPVLVRGTELSTVVGRNAGTGLLRLLSVVVDLLGPLVVGLVLDDLATVDVALDILAEGLTDPIAVGVVGTLQDAVRGHEGRLTLPHDAVGVEDRSSANAAEGDGRPVDLDGREAEAGVDAELRRGDVVRVQGAVLDVGLDLPESGFQVLGDDLHLGCGLDGEHTRSDEAADAGDGEDGGGRVAELQLAASDETGDDMDLAHGSVSLTVFVVVELFWAGEVENITISNLADDDA